MKFLHDLFGKKQKADAPTSKEIQQAQVMASKNCWHAALWWTTKALELNPDSPAARELFTQGVANTFLGVAKIIVRNKEESPYATKLLEQRHMSQQDAQAVAEWMISVYYAEQLQEKYGLFIERFNRGDIKRASRLLGSDLESAREMALSVGDELLPGQDAPVRWKSIMNPQADSFLASQISAHRETLITLLGMNSPSDWSNTCQKIYALWKDDPVESARELATRFRRMASDQLDNVEFRKRRDEFEQVFARNAAASIWTRNLIREPEPAKVQNE